METASQPCAHCGADLVPAEAQLLITRFPEHLPQCAIILLAGPGAATCARCGKATDVHLPHVVAGDCGGIVYIPNANAGARGFSEAQLRPQIERLEKEFSRGSFTIVCNKKAFRRTFLTQFIEPQNALAQAYQRQTGSRLEWVKAHEGELNAAFFGAMWLLSCGAIPIFQRPITAPPLPSSFIPHEKAPEAASNIDELRITRAELQKVAGSLLGALLYLWAVRASENQSLTEIQEKSAQHFLGTMLAPEVLATAAEELAPSIEHLKIGTRGAVLGRYLLEATLALVCHAYQLVNPRLAQWTAIQLLYDYERRADGNDGRVLLEPDLVRKTIRESDYWSNFASFIRARGLNELDSESLSDMERLVQTAARLYPVEVHNHIHFMTGVDPSLPDEKALDVYCRWVGRIFAKPSPNLFFLRTTVRGMFSTRRSLLGGFIQMVLETLEEPSAPPVTERAEVLRLLIQLLREVHEFTLATSVSDRLMKLMDSELALQIHDAQRAGLLNEVANIRRLRREFPEALRLYDQALALLGTDLNEPDVRVCMSNRAIILRDLYHFSEARAIFRSLHSYANESELRGSVVSEGACLYEMGLLSEALALLEAHRDLVEGRQLVAPHILNFCVLKASVLLGLGRIAQAQKAVIDLEKAPDFDLNHMAKAVVAHVGVAAVLARTDCQSGGSSAKPAADVMAAIGRLEVVLTPLRKLRAVPTSIVDAIRQYDSALCELGDPEKAEALLREVLEHMDWASSPNGWRLWLLSAGHALNRGDLERAVRDIGQCIGHLGTVLWHFTVLDDVPSLLAPQSGALAELMRKTFQLLGEPGVVRPEMARLAADLGAAPVLTTRLRRAVGLSMPIEDVTGEEDHIRLLLTQTSAVVLQFVEVGRDLGVVRTTINRDGGLGAHYQVTGIEGEEARAVGRRLDFHLRRLHPDAEVLGLERVRGWVQLEAALRTAVEDIPEQLTLCISPGPLSEAALSLALGERSLCFIPSLAALRSLRWRRQERFRSLQFRPRRWFDFVTWFDKERVPEADALADSVVQGARLAEQYGLSYEAASGTEATEERLLSGLATSDLARVACHGRIVPQAEAVDLVVAANGYLPPDDLTALRKSDAHIFSWRRLSTLTAAPAVVISSACDSGLNVKNEAGERLGLERPLFVAGTFIYVAPLWPVPTCAIQRVVSELIQRWLDSPETGLAVHLAQLRQHHLAAGVPHLAARALAVFGDAL